MDYFMCLTKNDVGVPRAKNGVSMALKAAPVLSHDSARLSTTS